MTITTLGIDLGKTWFYVHGQDTHGTVQIRKRFNRTQLYRFVAQLPPCRIAMEACAGAHYRGRKFRERGHDVKLIAPQFVKLFVKGNKNDFIDAEAVCEAASRPSMRFVTIKTPEQQSILALHRVRTGLIKQRTACINQMHGFLLECGISLPRGQVTIKHHLMSILEDADNDLPDAMRVLLEQLYQHYRYLLERVETHDRQIRLMTNTNEAYQRLMTIPGVGAIVATQLLAAVGHANDFRNGREMAAWLGLVPRQYSTGGKARLMGISKRGDPQLRTVLIHGARAMIRFVKQKPDAHSRWIQRLQAHRCGVDNCDSGSIQIPPECRSLRTESLRTCIHL